MLWRAFGGCKNSNTVSIPEIIESKAELLKSQYLALVYEMGELKIDGCRLVDQLQMRPGLSYWWMTLIAQKCNFAKSPFIDDIVRLLAFKHWAEGRRIEKISLTSSNPRLAQCLHLWCEQEEIDFKWHAKSSGLKTSMLTRISSSVPDALKALVWLFRYSIDRWPLRGSGVDEWSNSEGVLTFFTYSDNISPDALQELRYESRYWAHLPRLLDRENLKTNWLHLYYKDELLRTPKQAANVFGKINETEKNQCHTTLDSFLDFGIISNTLRDWMNLAKISRRIEKRLSLDGNLALSFWPFFKLDWRESMVGASCMSNMLHLNLFESALNHLPAQQTGVYLQENQAWETALIYTWNAANHGRLIGTPHTTVRFWDLRYFSDPRTLSSTDSNSMPSQDIVASNGPVMRCNLQSNGYPPKDLVDVEALRYLHLEKTHEKRGFSQIKKDSPVHLLVLGDYLLTNTQRQLDLLASAISLIEQKLIILVKPHPNCPIQAADYPTLEMKLSGSSISEALKDCDIAFASAASSAAVDAYCAEIPVISVLDPDTLNLSPLRGCPGAFFASSPRELAELVDTILSADSTVVNRTDFFTIDSKLIRWQTLLLE